MSELAGAPEQRMLRSATRRIAAQIALTVVLLLTVVGAVLFWIDQQAGRQNVLDALRQAVAAADAGRAAPNDALVVTRSATGAISATAHSPAAVASGLTLSRAPGLSEWEGPGGTEYRVLTVARPGGARLQALYDIQDFQDERNRLLAALLIADGLGALGAAGVAAVVANRAIRPLSDALVLQRRFVADASHELRAPLTLLHTRAQLLARQQQTLAGRAAGHGQAGSSGEEEYDLVAALVRDSRGLSEIVEDLLASAELPHHPAAHDVVDLAELAADVALSFRPLAERAGVHVRTELDGPVTVSGARPALRRAVSALLDNAVAHERPGGTITVAVRVDAARVKQPWAVLSVTDTGVGLDPAHADRLFARFARTTDAPGPGRRFGLGLALVRDVVTAHGGRVGVDGAPGAGATFTILLPAQATAP